MNPADAELRYEGTDYVCANCGCEITVKHSGDPSKMQEGSSYTCRCGTQMRMEHAPVGAGSQAG